MQNPKEAAVGGYPLRTASSDLGPGGKTGAPGWAAVRGLWERERQIEGGITFHGSPMECQAGLGGRDLWSRWLGSWEQETLRKV